MDLYLPDELKPFEPDLKFFFDLMIRKLHINRHKGFVEGKQILDLRNGLESEFEELKKALESESQFNVALECADLSNMAFLLALCCLKLSKDEYMHPTPPTREELEKRFPILTRIIKGGEYGRHEFETGAPITPLVDGSPVGGSTHDPNAKRS